MSARLNNAFFQNHAVFHHGAGLDAHRTEDDAVLHGALDDTARGDQGGAHGGARGVQGGRRVVDLGLDHPVGVEELLPDSPILQLHAGVQIVVDAVHKGQIAVKAVGAHLDIGESVFQNLNEIRMTHVFKILGQTQDQRPINDKAVEEQAVAGGAVGDIGDPAGGVQRQIVAGAILPLLHMAVQHGDAVAGVAVLGDHGLVVNITHHGAAADEDVVPVSPLEEAEIVEEIPEQEPTLGLPEAVDRAGQDEETAVFLVQTPLLTGTDVVDDAPVVVGGDEAHRLDTGVDHVADGEVQKAVPAAEGDGGGGAALR